MPEEPSMVAISTNTVANPDDIARRSFPAARRGVDADAVRRYLETLAGEVRDLLDRETSLRRRLADAERRAADPQIDEATLTRAVGGATARILETAHEAARDVVTKAEERAAELVAQAEQVLSDRSAEAEAEAEAMLVAAAEEAESLTARKVEEATRAAEEARAEAEELAEAAQLEAARLLDATKAECRQIVRQARELRKRVLEDLTQQRHALYVQLEQLRTGRDVLVDVVGAVGSAVDDVRERLANAEHDARVAAAEAGERVDLGEAAAELDAELAEHELQMIGDFEEESEEDDEARFYDREVEERTDEELELELAVDEGLAGELEEDEASEESEEAAAAEDSAASHRSVDELFARIRASRSADVTVTEIEDVEPAAVPAGESPEIEVAVAEIAVVEVEVAEVEPEAAATPAELGERADEPLSSHSAAVQEADESPDDEEAGAHPDEPIDADAAAMARRTELLAPLTTRLSRALKRALQDDQNELLDSIRHASGPPDLEKLLPASEQSARLERAVAGVLAECWTAGRPWLMSNGAGSKREKAIEEVAEQAAASEAGETFAAALSGELSGLLRHRLGESLHALGDLGDGAQDVAGAAYREWKGPRIEALAGDFAIRAFSSGAVTAAAGRRVRWVMDDDGQPCPDCDDNALAGEQAAGEPFPTGQIHPPVHPGCRCMLVPADD